MNKLKTFESFARDSFSLPFFNGMTLEEDEKVADALHKALGEFQNNYFEMDEPNLHFRDNQDLEETTRADYWLANDNVSDLNILSKHELDILKSLYPDETRKSSFPNSKGEYREWKMPAIYGTFLWYSIMKPGSKYKCDKREYRVWLVGKDEDHLFRVIDAEYLTHGKSNTIIRSAWDSAKKWEDLDSLLADQISHLRSIGTHIQEHCECEEDEKDSMRNEIDHDDPNAGLEPWR